VAYTRLVGLGEGFAPGQCPPPGAWVGVARQVGLALLASVVIFIVTRALPRTPMQVYLETHGQPVTPEALEALSRRWGLDRAVDWSIPAVDHRFPHPEPGASQSRPGRR